MGTWLSKKKLTINGLEEDEEDFAATLVDAKGQKFKPRCASVKGAIRLDPGHSKYYYKEKTTKQKIVIHFTVGYTSADCATLTGNTHVSVSYVVARNGNVYELFNPDYWSFHLGPGSTGGNTVQSKSTIGIEVSNFGPLTEHPTKPDILMDIYGFPYCMKEHTDYYVYNPYRGYDYYATFTDAQYQSLDSLLLRLCRKYDIVHSFLPPEDRLKHFNEVPKAGILTHANYRSDKQDVGPAFDWLRVSGR